MPLSWSRLLPTQHAPACACSLLSPLPRAWLASRSACTCARSAVTPASEASAATSAALAASCASSAAAYAPCAPSCLAFTSFISFSAQGRTEVDWWRRRRQPASDARSGGVGLAAPPDERPPSSALLQRTHGHPLRRVLIQQASNVRGGVLGLCASQAAKPGVEERRHGAGMRKDRRGSDEGRKEAEDMGTEPAATTHAAPQRSAPFLFAAAAFSLPFSRQLAIMGVSLGSMESTLHGMLEACVTEALGPSPPAKRKLPDEPLASVGQEQRCLNADAAAEKPATQQEGGPVSRGGVRARRRRQRSTARLASDRSLPPLCTPPSPQPSGGAPPSAKKLKLDLGSPAATQAAAAPAAASAATAADAAPTEPAAVQPAATAPPAPMELCSAVVLPSQAAAPTCAALSPAAEPPVTAPNGAARSPALALPAAAAGLAPTQPCCAPAVDLDAAVGELLGGGEEEQPLHSTQLAPPVPSSSAGAAALGQHPAGEPSDESTWAQAEVGLEATQPVCSGDDSSSVEVETAEVDTPAPTCGDGAAEEPAAEEAAAPGSATEPARTAHHSPPVPAAAPPTEPLPLPALHAAAAAPPTDAAAPPACVASLLAIAAAHPPPPGGGLLVRCPAPSIHSTLDDSQQPGQPSTHVNMLKVVSFVFPPLLLCWGVALLGFVLCGKSLHHCVHAAGLYSTSCPLHSFPSPPPTPPFLPLHRASTTTFTSLALPLAASLPASPPASPTPPARPPTASPLACTAAGPPAAAAPRRWVLGAGHGRLQSFELSSLPTCPLALPLSYFLRHVPQGPSPSPSPPPHAAAAPRSTSEFGPIADYEVLANEVGAAAHPRSLIRCAPQQQCACSNPRLLCNPDIRHFALPPLLTVRRWGLAAWGACTLRCTTPAAGPWRSS